MGACSFRRLHRFVAFVVSVSSVPKKSQKKTMTQYRYKLERYRGRTTRHVYPQCGRKNVFTRYIDTENNIYTYIYYIIIYQ